MIKMSDIAISTNSCPQCYLYIRIPETLHYLFLFKRRIYRRSAKERERRGVVQLPFRGTNEMKVACIIEIQIYNQFH
jgi:hypothetical protein